MNLELNRFLNPPAPQLISTDEDTTLKVIVAITSGMSGVAEKVQGYLGYWEKKYKHIWEQDKEAYIRRWARHLCAGVATF